MNQNLVGLWYSIAVIVLEVPEAVWVQLTAPAEEGSAIAASTAANATNHKPLRPRSERFICLKLLVHSDTASTEDFCPTKNGRAHSANNLTIAAVPTTTIRPRRASGESRRP